MERSDIVIVVESLSEEDHPPNVESDKSTGDDEEAAEQGDDGKEKRKSDTVIGRRRRETHSTALAGTRFVRVIPVQDSDTTSSIEAMLDDLAGAVSSAAANLAASENLAGRRAA